MTDNRFTCFLIGLSLGAGVSMLCAPMSGKKARRLIVDKVQEGKTSVERGSEAMRASATEFLERSKKNIQSTTDALAAAVEAGKDVLHAHS